MSSIIKANEIQNSSGGADVKIQTLKHPSSSSNNLVLASDGSATINQISSSTVFPAGGTGNPISVAVIADEKGSLTGGGTFTAGAWQTRDLNTEISDADGIVSIASNQFTLGAGTYLIEWSCPVYVVNRHQTKLYSITNSSDLAKGTSEYSDNGNAVQNRSFGAFVHTISASHTYEIRHYAITSSTTLGFGVNGGTGINSVYTLVKISKLK